MGEGKKGGRRYRQPFFPVFGELLVFYEGNEEKYTTVTSYFPILRLSASLNFHQ